MADFVIGFHLFWLWKRFIRLDHRGHLNIESFKMLRSLLFKMGILKKEISSLNLLNTMCLWRSISRTENVRMWKIYRFIMKQAFGIRLGILRIIHVENRKFRKWKKNLTLKISKIKPARKYFSIFQFTLHKIVFFYRILFLKSKIDIDI